MTKGNAQKHVDILYEQIFHLVFDPKDRRWGDASSFLSYSPKKGRSFFDDFRQLSNFLASKWHGLVPNNFTLA